MRKQRMNFHRRCSFLALVCASPILFGTAHAQSSVSLYGTVDAAIGSMKASGGPPSTAVVDSSAMTTSYWGIKGIEELGGGLAAEFTLESFFQTDNGKLGRFTGDPMFARNAFVGLRSDQFGTIKLGRNTTPWFVSMLLFNPLADSATLSPMFLHTYTTPPGSPFAYSVAGDTAWDNSILYQSPGFGGLRFNAIYSTGESVGHQGKQNYGANVTYFSGPFAATAAVQRVAVNAPEFTGTGEKYQMAYLAGLSYDFSVVKVFGQYAQTTNNYSAFSNQRDRTVQAGVSAPVGPGSLLVSWARTNQSSNEIISSAHRDTASVVYDYFFSKRTDMYAAYRYDKVSSLGTGNSFLLGLRHKF